MITEHDLNICLKHWVKEYSPRMEIDGGSHNLIQSLMEHRGFVPSARGFVGVQLGTVGDEIEAGVIAMEHTPGEAGLENVLFRSAKVMRIDCFCRFGMLESQRLRVLSKIGIRVTKYGYRQAILKSRAFLIGWLEGGAYLRGIEKRMWEV